MSAVTSRLAWTVATIAGLVTVSAVYGLLHVLSAQRAVLEALRGR